MSTTQTGSQPTTSELSTQEPTHEQQQPSSSASETRPQRLSEAEKAKRVNDLLFGAPEDDGDEADDRDERGRFIPHGGDDDGDEDEEGGASERVAAPKTLDQLRDALQLDDAALYGIEVTTGDGETVKLGALKDAYQDRQKAARETAKREAALDVREAALVNDQQLWQQIGNELGASVKPETLNTLKGRMQQHAVREQEALLTAMPELRDEAVFKNWRGEVVKFLHEGYGFKPQELVITDHRILVVMRDFMRTKARLDKLLSYEPDAKAPGSKRPKPKANGTRTRQQMFSRARTGNEAQKVSAITTLLNGR